jgi:hypothetical protein
VTAVSASAEGESPVGYYFSENLFKAESYPIRVAARDSGNTLFNPTGAGTSGGPGVKCTTGDYLGQSSQTGQTNVPPPFDFEYTGCTPTGTSGSVTVAVNGCTWTFGANVSKGFNTAYLDCPEGKEIEIKTYNTKSELKCTTTIPEQGPFTGVTFSTSGSGSSRSVTTTMFITPVTNTTVSSNILLCGGGPVGTTTYHGGRFEGSFNLKDYRNFFTL